MRRGKPMVIGVGVTLRRPKRAARPARKKVHYEMREDLKAYVDRIKAEEERHHPEEARDQSDIINDSLDYWRRIETSLEPFADAIEGEAVRLGLDMDERLADVLVALVRAGLDSTPNQKPKK